MRTQSQTIVMYGFLVACVLSIVSMFLPAYTLNSGSTAFSAASQETYRIASSYYSWPILVVAVGGIIVILMMYRRKYVMISGGIQAVALLYQIYRIANVQDQFNDPHSALGTLSELYAEIGGGSGFSMTLGIGFYMAIIAACVVALFTLLCFFMVEDQY